MKKCLFLIISLISYLGGFAQTATEYFSVGNPLKYCGEKYYLSWSANPQENYFIQEYLPKGETLAQYNQMFTVSVIFGDWTPSDAIQAKIAELDKRKNTDPMTNYIVVENDGDYILEFIVSDTKKRRNEYR